MDARQHLAALDNASVQAEDIRLCASGCCKLGTYEPAQIEKTRMIPVYGRGPPVRAGEQQGAWQGRRPHRSTFASPTSRPGLGRAGELQGYGLVWVAMFCWPHVGAARTNHSTLASEAQNRIEDLGRQLPSGLYGHLQGPGL